jgi:predicted RNA-binding Zn ribbon-like protein
MTARVAFKKKKKVHERVMWVVSVFDDPNDIRNYDRKTMHRLETELYGKNAKSEKHIIIREIVEKKLISYSNLTLDEHKKQNQEQVQEA